MGIFVDVHNSNPLQFDLDDERTRHKAVSQLPDAVWPPDIVRHIMKFFRVSALSRKLINDIKGCTCLIRIGLDKPDDYNITEYKADIRKAHTLSSWYKVGGETEFSGPPGMEMEEVD